MSAFSFSDELSVESSEQFRRMVESVGVKRFSDDMGLSTRQINRMLSGAQPNPVERIVRALQSCQPDEGDEALAYICQEAGGLFVKEEPDLDAASVNAVKECAEAIAAISDGRVSPVDEREVRDAICALTALLRAVRENHGQDLDGPVRVVDARAALNGARVSGNGRAAATADGPAR